MADEANLVDYASKSEFINELIRRERERQRQLSWLNAELEKGYSAPLVGATSLQDIKSSVLGEKKIVR